MNNIKLVDHTYKLVHSKTYKLEIDGYTYHWLEYIDSKGKVIDSAFLDENGNEVGMMNPELANQVMDFVDGLGNKG